MRQYRNRENDQRMKYSFRDILTRGAPPEKVHADVAKSARNGCAARLNLGGAAHPCDQDQTKRGPCHAQSLPRSNETDYPPNKDGRSEIDESADLEVDI